MIIISITNIKIGISFDIFFILFLLLLFNYYVSARELEERVNTVKSDLDKMSAHIDLKTPKLRPWDDAQLGKLQDLLNEIE